MNTVHHRVMASYKQSYAVLALLYDRNCQLSARYFVLKRLRSIYPNLWVQGLPRTLAQGTFP